MFRSGTCKLSRLTRGLHLPLGRHEPLPTARQNLIPCRPPTAVVQNESRSSTCNPYFSTSPANRLPLPPIAALVLRPVAKFLAMMLGIRIRRWWSKLSDRDKRRFWRNVRRRRGQITAAAGGCAALFAAYCAAHTELDPVTGQRRLILFTRSQMVALADAIVKELLDENALPVYAPQHPYHKRALSIATRLVDANKAYDHLRDDRKWFVVVLDDPRVNAMVLPNGMIIVFAGLLRVANDQQVAVVLAHEIAHCLLDHHAIRLSREHVLELLWLIPLTAMWAVFPVPEAVLGFLLGHYFKSVALLLPYERHQEIEADKYGLMLAANACVDVRQAVVFWRKMETLDPANELGVRWLSTHPPHSERVAYIENLLPHALQLRRQNGCPPLDVSYWSRFSLF